MFSGGRPLNLGGKLSPPKFWGWSVQSPLFYWETDFYTPPVLGGAALLPFSAPAVYKNLVP